MQNHAQYKMKLDKQWDWIHVLRMKCMHQKYKSIKLVDTNCLKQVNDPNITFMHMHVKFQIVLLSHLRRKNTLIQCKTLNQQKT